MRDTPLNSARLLLPAAHFIRTNYLKSKVVCISLYFASEVTALVVDFSFCVECSVIIKLCYCNFSISDQSCFLLVCLVTRPFGMWAPLHSFWKVLLSIFLCIISPCLSFKCLSFHLHLYIIMQNPLATLWEGENCCCRNLLNGYFSSIVLLTLNLRDRKLFCMF